MTACAGIGWRENQCGKGYAQPMSLVDRSDKTFETVIVLMSDAHKYSSNKRNKIGGGGGIKLVKVV